MSILVADNTEKDIDHEPEHVQQSDQVQDGVHELLVVVFVLFVFLLDKLLTNEEAGDEG